MRKHEIDELRADLFEQLNEVEKIEILQKVKFLLAAEQEESEIVGYEPDGKPITLGDLRKRIAHSEEQLAQEESISLDDFDKMSEEWLR